MEKTMILAVEDPAGLEPENWYRLDAESMIRFARDAINNFEEDDLPKISLKMVPLGKWLEAEINGIKYEEDSCENWIPVE